jgi:signal transduction histidine kinase
MNGLESGVAVFQPRARLLKLIGAELISDEVVALAELVKNAHDADASMVTIKFGNITGPNGEIVVQDDGEGMDRDILLKQWMEPAGTTKVGGDGRFTSSGRRVLGEKGVGRFAADKLARSLELVSRKGGDNKEVRAVFDWDEFDSDSLMLSEVQCRWEVRPAGQNSRGTKLRLTQLRTTWNERMFRRVSTRLSRLPSPFETHNSFCIRIECDDFPQYSGELRAEFLKLSPYRIDAEFDGQQTVKVKLNGANSVRHLWNGEADLKCGLVRIRLFAFDLESEAIAKIGSPVDVRAWLKEWSGVSIYRDGFRIWPYGEPHDDWLRLDQRRVNNPVLRLSNNQLLGFVEISGDRNPDLKDQTNREGLINNGAFQDLRRLVYFLMQILEAERQSIRHPKVGLKQAPAQRASAALSLDRLAAHAPRKLQIELNRVATEIRQEAVRTDLHYRSLLEGYSELAAIGQAAIKLSEWTEPLQGDVVRQFEKLQKLTRRHVKPAVLHEFEELRNSLNALFGGLALMAPFGRSNGPRGRLIDVLPELEMFRSMISPLLRSSGVHMNIEVTNKASLRVQMHPESLWRLLLILTLNSLDCLHEARTPQIRIAAQPKGDACEIVFSDNGPGIPVGLTEKVFEPLFSTREGGRGMGLAIARDILSRHRGRIEVLTDRRRRGAHMVIILQRKRTRLTHHN